MFAAVRTTDLPTRRCAWRASLHLMCAAALFAAGACGGSVRLSPNAAASDVAGGEAGQGGPYIPVDLMAVKHSLVQGTVSMDRLHPVPDDDALDLSASLWASPAVGTDEHNLPQRLPVTPLRITSGFGRRHDPLGRGDAFHSGIDFAGKVGTAVHASGDGVVVQARYNKDYGNVVMIDHGHGVVTLYAHNSKLEVRNGDVVLAGQEIAKMGSTGRSTGPHLHFEVRQYGQRIDPGRYLAGL
jgi:murein DD-endopeptidase MepM/ murein hydrolase activator NlpD